jgi:hypothetical protein
MSKKPRIKKTVEAAPGVAFEALLNMTIKEQAEQKERLDQVHLTRRAWQLYGNLIRHGVFEPPDLAVAEAIDDHAAMLVMAEQILDVISAIVLSFEAGGYGPHGDEEF